MKFGVSVPNFGEYFDARATAALARDAEEAGWDGLFVWDHMLGGEWMRGPMADPWILLAACAMVTSRIRLGPMVTPLARRRPWKVARETVTLDHLSGGRLILGVGLGFPPEEEFARFGEEQDDHLRAAKLDEALDVVTGLWTGEPFSHAGQCFRIDDVTFVPKPLQQPRIPIWCAAMLPARPPLRRAARYDGVVPLKISANGIPELLAADEIREIIAYVGQHRAVAGPFDVAIAGVFTRDPSEAADLIAEREAAGATWCIEDGIAHRGIDALRARVRLGPSA